MAPPLSSLRCYLARPMTASHEAFAKQHSLRFTMLGKVARMIAQSAPARKT
jgi:hypothetical protein